MAMTSGGRRGGSIGEINMTPMIDVLLVLLIIFLVVQQGLQRGLSVQVPPPPDGKPVLAQPGTLVLDLAPGGDYRLNRQPVARERLAQELGAVFAGRTRKMLFVRGAESLPYGEVIGAVDASRQAGVQVVGLVPRS
ncbi:MAG TPA: biopolymer transporter ExbD [Longimicrobium sp.]|nr:biopolymer transporter ExbD [Longimicrobium sp.]